MKWSLQSRYFVTWSLQQTIVLSMEHRLHFFPYTPKIESFISNWIITVFYFQNTLDWDLDKEFLWKGNELEAWSNFS